jgi:hypothetical protein
MNIDPNYVYIVSFYKNDDLVKQKNFKQNLEGAKKFISENKKSERAKGISMSIFHGYVNEDFPCEDA